MRTRNLLLGLVMAASLVVARPAQAQFVSGAVGALAGLTSGGYATLAIVVARAQFGHYLHDADDLLGWNSVPVVLGVSIGTAVGAWDADRMITGFAYGAGGALVGGALGFVVGPQIWPRPEGKWAGGAIGAGVGMAAGYFLGVLIPQKDIAPDFLRNTSAVPISITIPVP